GQQALDELPVPLRDHRLEAADQFLGREVGAFIGGGHDDVHPVRLAVHVVVDPGELLFELFGGEVEGAEHAHSTFFADGGHHVAAVAYREDREVDSDHVRHTGPHVLTIRPRTLNCNTFYQ